MRTVFNPRAGAAATGLFLGGLAISGAVALVTAPLTPRLAIAETVANPDVRPTVRILPASTGSVSTQRRIAPSIDAVP